VHEVTKRILEMSDSFALGIKYQNNWPAAPIARLTRRNQNVPGLRFCAPPRQREIGNIVFRQVVGGYFSIRVPNKQLAFRVTVQNLFSTIPINV